jgi:hypothetical protein
MDLTGALDGFRGSPASSERPDVTVKRDKKELPMPSEGVSKREMQRRAEMRGKNAEIRKLDAARAVEAQRIAKAAEQAKTQRLRALRLAKMAEADASAKQPRKKKAAAKA